MTREDKFPAGVALALAAVYAFLVDFATDTPRVGPHFVYWGLPWPGHASQTTSAVNGALLALVALPFAVSPLARWPRPRLPRWLAPGWVLLPIAAAAVAFLWTRPFVPRPWALAWNALVVAAPVAMAAAAVLQRRSSWLAVAAIAAVAGTLVRAVHFQAFAFNVGADMLPLTDAALTNLFAGKSPYATHMVPGPLPLTYYPLTFLAYAPAKLLGLDLRWTNVLAELAVASAVFKVARENDDLRALAVWAMVYLAPSSVYFSRITTAPIAWAAIAWTLVLVVAGARAAWVAVGLLGATTPLAVVFAPLVLVLWWRRDGARAALMRVAGATAVATVIIAPFFLWAPRDFIDGAILWFNDLDRFPRTKWQAFMTWQRYVGLSGLFWRTGHEAWLKPLQLASVLGVTAWFARSGAPNAVFRHAALAFTLFMIVNPVLWPYFYQPAIVVALLAAAAATRVRAATT